MASKSEIFTSLKEAERYAVILPSPAEHILKREVDLFCKHIGKDEAVMDIGCGKGACIRLFQERNHNCFGTDISINNLYACRLMGLDVLWCDVCNMYMIESDSMPHIFCRTTMNYVYDRNKALEEMFRILLPGGKIYISVGIGDKPQEDKWSSNFSRGEEDVIFSFGNYFEKVFIDKILYQESMYLRFIGKKKEK